MDINQLMKQAQVMQKKMKQQVESGFWKSLMSLK